MNKLFKTFALLAIFSGSVQLFAQDYSPDVSLTYPVFLDQCINFKDQPQKQAWVVFFWASWNSKSLYEISTLQSLHQTYQGKPVRFVSVSVDKIRSKWEKVLKSSSTRMPWEHLLIEREDDLNFLKRAFPHKSMPGMFVVKPDGMIHQAINSNELTALLQEATSSLPNKPLQVSNTHSAPSGSSSAPASVPIADNNANPATSSVPPASSSSWATHTVKSGETLFSLYRKYQVPVSEIKRVNGLTSNNIRIGQVLKIKRQ